MQDTESDNKDVSFNTEKNYDETHYLQKLSNKCTTP